MELAMGKLIRTDLSEQIFETLRYRITNLLIAPGEKIDINALSEEFAVSPIPIREALKRLTERQLIIATPGVGYRSTEMSTKDIMDAFAFRKMLEIYVLPAAMRAVSHTRLTKLRESSISLLESDMPRQERRKAFNEMDICLHRELILGSSDNRFIGMVADIVGDLLHIARRMSWQLDQSLNEHVTIIDAWIERDELETNRTLSMHLDRSMQECLRPTVSGQEDRPQGSDE
jgi:DNA-binding GntR family transcriptional regulator